MTPFSRSALYALVVSTAVCAADELSPFSAVYEVRHSGARVGETVLSLTEDADAATFELVSRTEPKGLAALIRRRDVVETTSFEIVEGVLRPLRYVFDEGSSRGKRNGYIEFDWDAKTARSSYKDATQVLDLEEGTVDRLSVQIVVMHDLTTDTLKDAYTVVDRNAIKTYEYRKLGTEKMSTPAGTFETIKLRRQRPGSSRATWIWAAPAYDYLPVKMVQLKDERPAAVLTVISIEGFEPAESVEVAPPDVP